MTEVTGDGEAVGLYLPGGEKKVFILKKGGIIHTRHGWVSHNDLIGLTFGSRIKLSTGREAVVFKPTLEEKVMELFDRKSQVIYPKDACVMIGMSGITDGSKVGEAGVGSGYLSAFLLDRIGERGEYVGYDTRKDMLETARRNLAKIFPYHRIRLVEKDVRMGVDERGFDAFFLDIPDPWKALGKLHSSLNPPSRIVVFTPTVNQVIKLAYYVSKEKGFILDRIITITVQEHEKAPAAIRPKMMQWIHTGYISLLIRIG